MSKKSKKPKSKDAFDDLLDMADQYEKDVPHPWEPCYQLETPVMDELKRRDSRFCDLDSFNKPLPEMTWADRVFLNIADKHGLEIYGNGDPRDDEEEE